MSSATLTTLRLFIALPLEAETQAQLALVSQHFAGTGAAIRWVRPQNIHLTLKFLGDVPAGDLDRVKESVQKTLCGTTRALARIAGVGAFPGGGRPEVIWAGVQDEAGRIVAIQGALEANLETMGFARDRRAYAPHITLGRVKLTRQIRTIHQQVTTATLLPIPFSVDRVRLVASELTREGPIYRPVQEWRLGDPETEVRSQESGPKTEAVTPDGPAAF